MLVSLQKAVNIKRGRAARTGGSDASGPPARGMHRGSWSSALIRKVLSPILSGGVYPPDRDRIFQSDDTEDNHGTSAMADRRDLRSVAGRGGGAGRIRSEGLGQIRGQRFAEQG